MKPIKLEMCAFGPFAGRETIDFTQFGDHGIFLTTGITGAGKSTIYDAICFALYGKSSGGSRSGTELRSDFAKPEQETYVELTFTHRGKTCRLRRSPAYMRAKVRGTGLTQVTESAEFEQEGELPVSGTRKVDEAVQNLLRLDYGQFKQTSMLAQGEFRDLLTADSKTRQAILQKIFDTGPYYEMGEIMMRKRREAEEDLRQAEQLVLHEFSSAEFPEEGELAVRAAALRANPRAADHAEEIGLLFEELIRTDAGIYEEETRKNEAAHAEYKELSDYGEALTALAAAERRTAAQKTEYEQLTGESVKAEESKKEAEAHLSEAETIRKEALQMQLLEDRYEKRDLLLKKIAKTEKAEELNRRKAEKEAADENALKETIRKNEEREAALRNAPQELAELEHRLERLNSIRREYKVWKKETDGSYMDLVKEAAQAEDACEKALSDFLKQENRTAHAEDLLDRNRAGILAAGLTEGQPCPVCGATHHPSPAVLSGESVSEEQLKKEKKALETQRKVKEKAVTESGRLKARQKAVEENLCGDGRQILEKYRAEIQSGTAGSESPGMNIPELAQMLEREDSALQKLKKDLEGLIEKKKTETNALRAIEKSLPEDRQQLERLQELRKETEAAAKELAASYAAAKSSLSEIGELPFPDHRSAVSAREAKEKKAEALLKAIADSQRMLEAKRTAADTAAGVLKRCREEETEKRAAVEGFSREIPDKAEKMISESRSMSGEAMSSEEKAAVLEGILAKCREDLEKADRLIVTRSNRLHSNERIAKRFQDEVRRMQEARHARDLRASLAEILRGTAAGKTRISFEQYVQTAGFDGILQAANRRLVPMSGGQFELRRHNTDGELGGGRALAIDVMDYHTGKTRSASTLSGGESFKAALSLALGMSDCISQAAGGISIDTLFVDEGFGSLDREESLDAAIETLTALSESNKLIGVISHVSDLKERIPKQIRVAKAKNGSTLSVDTGE